MDINIYLFQIFSNYTAITLIEHEVNTNLKVEYLFKQNYRLKQIIFFYYSNNVNNKKNTYRQTFLLTTINKVITIIIIYIFKKN